MSATIHLLNPAAGKGQLPSIDSLDGEVYLTKGIGDGAEYLSKRLKEDGTYRVYVYGGDGTLNEAVNGIMAAGAGDRVTLTPVPTGSGNDFYRISSLLTDKTPSDVIKYNGKYALNLVNIGFDCAVAAKMSEYKSIPLVSGSFAYVLGVVSEFIKKTPTKMKITLTYADGTEESFSDEYLLCAIANGKFYGGGFKAAPAADIRDGLLDVLVVKNMSRMRFISLIGDYKKGTHLNTDTLESMPKFADIFEFRRAVKLRINGAHRFAADGEIIDIEDGILDVSIIPGALNVAPMTFRESVALSN